MTGRNAQDSGTRFREPHQGERNQSVKSQIENEDEARNEADKVRAGCKIRIHNFAGDFLNTACSRLVCS